MPYFTPIDRQIWSPNLTEKLYLIPKSLSLPTTFYNLIQSISYILVLIITNGIMRNFDLKRRMRLSILLILASSPSIFYEASTTQNDLFVGLLAVINLQMLIPALNKKATYKSIIPYVCTIGLLISAKGTGYFLAASSLLIFLVANRNSIEFKVKTVMFSLIGTLLYSGHLFLNNFQFYGNPLGPSLGSVTSGFTSRQNPGDLLTGVIRFLATNAQIANEAWNQKIFSIAKSVADSLQLDLSDNYTGFTGSFGMTIKPYFSPSFGWNEDAVVSNLNLFAFLWLIFIIVWRVKTRKLITLPYTLALLALSNYLLLIFLIRWNPWFDRYFIAPSILAIIAIAIYYSRSRIANRIIMMLSIFSMLIGLQALPSNLNRPLLGPNNIFELTKSQEQFLPRPTLRPSFQALEWSIRENDVKRIYMDIGSDDWAYPIILIANSYKLEFHYLSNEDKKLNSSDLIVCYTTCATLFNTEEHYGAKIFIIH